MSGLLTCSAESTVVEPISITDMLEMGDMHDENAKVESLFTTLETGEMAIASLESLVAYKEDLITSDATVSKQTVEALNITLESVCNILDYPVDHVTMSTESITEDDTTLVLATGLEKEKGLLAKAWEAVRYIIKQILRSIPAMIAKLKTKFLKLDKVLLELKYQAKSLSNIVTPDIMVGLKFTPEVSNTLLTKFTVLTNAYGNKTLNYSVLTDGLTEYNAISNPKVLTTYTKQIQVKIKKSLALLKTAINDPNADFDKILKTLEDHNIDLVAMFNVRDSSVINILRSRKPKDTYYSAVGHYGNVVRAITLTEHELKGKTVIGKINITNVPLDINVNKMKVAVVPPMLIITDSSVDTLITNINANVKDINKVISDSESSIKELDKLAKTTDGEYNVIIKHMVSSLSSSIMYVNKLYNYSITDSYKYTVATLSYFRNSIKVIEQRTKK